MFARPGATFGLSLVIFLVAAIVLYRPERPPLPPPPAADESVAVPPSIPDLPASPESRDEISHDSEMADSSATPPTPAEPIETIEPIEPDPNPIRPHSPVTATLEGETLGDFARRVYGDPGQVGTIWAVNRDRLPAIEPDPDYRPETGTLLRTPDPATDRSAQGPQSDFLTPSTLRPQT